jgi:hypothetical protein
MQLVQPPPLRLLPQGGLLAQLRGAQSSAQRRQYLGIDAAVSSSFAAAATAGAAAAAATATAASAAAATATAFVVIDDDDVLALIPRVGANPPSFSSSSSSVGKEPYLLPGVINPRGGDGLLRCWSLEVMVQTPFIRRQVGELPEMLQDLLSLGARLGVHGGGHLAVAAVQVEPFGKQILKSSVFHFIRYAQGLSHQTRRAFKHYG